MCGEDIDSDNSGMRYLAVESQTARRNVNLRGAARPSLWVVWPKGLHRFVL
jgi:hypothetical protein